ncbi:MmgE/PrpD family protein [Pollutimonas bauzanensis]|uniref:2-methylcitrate dehydratase PrpD n=1 Tax=Pollutimonas bauzanensis TaxID=658167 RepID=A0A1M5QXW5_9BURK|nr:MmgE/PrpD family protein [Pollutimonas bauzanensis]SHH18995.1 2-methylcitrate dehydratase PrpD [Pollutimonas bauzanensis]
MTGEKVTPAAGGLTATLAARAVSLRYAQLPEEVRTVAQDCLVDWLGCALGALGEPVSQIVAEVALEEGGHGQATVIGRAEPATLMQAALINGAVSHALDYDDVNLTVPGHMSVAILPALLALAEQRNAGAAEFLAAFVSGYETACRVGALVEPAHYANGFHATATIGSLGAAVACAHLLGLDAEQTAHALGVAATQASGLKAMFGTMAKPLHAGLAAQAGLRAASLAQKGFVSRADVLECPQGFAQVHGSDFHPEAALAQPPGGFHLLGNLFKFHAACYSTHSTIEAIMALREQHGLHAASVRGIHVLAGEGCRICNIQQPATAMEAKFSLRATAAFAVLGMPTHDLDCWSRVAEPEVVSMLNRVHIELVPGMSLSESVVTVTLEDGRALRQAFDCGIPMADKSAQSARVRSKFAALAEPVLGIARLDSVLAALAQLEQAGGIAALARTLRVRLAQV